jgi:hypothetical protein
MTTKKTINVTGTRPEKSRTSTPHRQPHRPNETWRPQPCGISREDMRQIVLEMIG